MDSPKISSASRNAERSRAPILRKYPMKRSDASVSPWARLAQAIITSKCSMSSRRTMRPRRARLASAKATWLSAFIAAHGDLAMGTASYILAGVERRTSEAFASACHGAGREMSRHEAKRRWQGRAVVDDLAAKGILIRSASHSGIAEEAPGAYKDITTVIEATHN